MSHGVFSYALDDAYIHLSIAKNLYLNHVWGVTQYGFTNASSSVLWPLMLWALFHVTVSAWWPLVVNVACISGAVLAANSLMEVYIGPWRRVAACLLIVWAGPLPTLALDGMEHGVQVLASILLVHHFLRGSRWMLLDAFILGGIRYEGPILVGFIALFVSSRRDWKTALLMVGAAATPILVMGCVSVAHGWPFIPTSILVKSHTGAHHGIHQLLSIDNRHLLWFTLAGLAIISTLVTVQPRRAHMALGAICATVASQALFGQFGWFYRYEAYLMALLIIALAITLRLPTTSGPPSFAGLMLIPVFLTSATGVLSALDYGSAAYGRTGVGMHNIYESDYQLAVFLQTSDAVVVNDIGWVDWTAPHHQLDLGGLSSLQVAKAILEHRLNAVSASELAAANGGPIVVYPNIFQFPLPWKPVGGWTIQDNIEAGGPTYQVFNSTEWARFSITMPPEVSTYSA